jgi:SAM-dependent methyltransferase
MERSEDIADTAAFFDRAIRDIAAGRSAGQVRVPDARVLDVRVLDFGCGAGQLVERMSRLGYDAYGCDIYADPAASDRCRQIEFSPYRLPFADDSFDIVLSTSVLEHANNPGEYLPEIRRVLKPGGTAMHLLPGKWYLPREPHILVPFANYFYPRCPSWWFAMWAMLGVCHPEHKGEGWRHVVAQCRAFYDHHVFYLSSAEHERLSRAVFGNCEWPMEFYIAHAHGAFAGLCRRLPLRKLWGLVSREFRMGFLVQRKLG